MYLDIRTYDAWHGLAKPEFEALSHELLASIFRGGATDLSVFHSLDLARAARVTCLYKDLLPITEKPNVRAAPYKRFVATADKELTRRIDTTGIKRHIPHIAFTVRQGVLGLHMSRNPRHSRVELAWATPENWIAISLRMLPGPTRATWHEWIASLKRAAHDPSLDTFTDLSHWKRSPNT